MPDSVSGQVQCIGFGDWGASSRLLCGNLGGPRILHVLRPQQQAAAAMPQSEDFASPKFLPTPSRNLKPLRFIAQCERKKNTAQDACIVAQLDRTRGRMRSHKPLGFVPYSGPPLIPMGDGKLLCKWSTRGLTVL